MGVKGCRTESWKERDCKKSMRNLDRAPVICGVSSAACSLFVSQALATEERIALRSLNFVASFLFSAVSILVRCVGHILQVHDEKGAGVDCSGLGAGRPSVSCHSSCNGSASRIDLAFQSVKVARHFAQAWIASSRKCLHLQLSSSSMATLCRSLLPKLRIRPSPRGQSQSERTRSQG